MIDSEQKQFDREICRRWYQKFDAAKLNEWWEELKSYDLKEIFEAFRKFQQHSRFVPTLFEIKNLLPRRAGTEPATIPMPPFSEMIRRNSPSLPREASAIEILMRYWRAEWWRYKADADKRRETMDRIAPAAAARAGISEELYRKSKAFITATEMFEKQYQGELTRCLVGCANGLAAEGVPLAHCPNYADWIEVGPEHFRSFLQDLRLSQVVDPFANKESLYAGNV